MRSRTSLFALLFTVGFFALPHLAHAGIPFFGPIIPGSNIPGNINAVCPAGWGMMMTVINNIISLLLTVFIVFLTPLVLTYAGFLLVFNQGDPGKVSEARKVITNTIVGIVVALASWMIVDAIMAALYSPGNAGGTWSTMIYSNGNFCLPQAGALSTDVLNPATTIPGVIPGAGTTLSTNLSNVPGNPCNPATIMGATSATASQANLLACVAQGESTCGTTNPPYNLNYSWNVAGKTGSASTAAGAYQVLLASNHLCYETKPCYMAVGLPADGGTKLNCQTGFDPKGFPLPGSAVVETCKKAAGNVACSASAAVCLLNKQSFSSAYATDTYTAGCISKYGG